MLVAPRSFLFPKIKNFWEPYKLEFSSGLVKREITRVNGDDFFIKKITPKSATFFLVAGVEGIEPSIMVLETIAIPFNYTPKTLLVYTNFSLFVNFFI